MNRITIKFTVFLSIQMILAFSILFAFVVVRDYAIGKISIADARDFARQKETVKLWAQDNIKNFENLDYQIRRREGPGLFSRVANPTGEVVGVDDSVYLELNTDKKATTRIYIKFIFPKDLRQSISETVLGWPEESPIPEEQQQLEELLEDKISQYISNPNLLQTIQSTITPENFNRIYDTRLFSYKGKHNLNIIDGLEEVIFSYDAIRYGWKTGLNIEEDSMAGTIFLKYSSDSINAKYGTGIATNFAERPDIIKYQNIIGKTFFIATDFPGFFGWLVFLPSLLIIALVFGVVFLLFKVRIYSIKVLIIYTFAFQLLFFGTKILIAFPLAGFLAA